MRKPPIYKSFGYALAGLFRMLRSERNFQIEILALVFNLFLIVYLDLNPKDAAIILLTCFAVLSAECLNTAIEKLCDLVQPDYDIRVKWIKDTAAAAVLLLAIISVFIGVLVYSGYVFGF